MKTVLLLWFGVQCIHSITHVYSTEESSLESTEEIHNDLFNPSNKPMSDRKPNLSCLLFGQSGCEISCTILCALMGCEVEHSVCENRFYCICNEVYHFDNLDEMDDHYQEQLLDELWALKFEKSSASVVVADRIKANNELQGRMLHLLQNTHMTGSDIKQELMNSYPRWQKLRELNAIQKQLEEYELAPRVIKVIDDFDDAEKIKNTKYRKRVIRLIEQTKDEEYVNNIIEKIRYINNGELYDYVISYFKDKGRNLGRATKSKKSPKKVDEDLEIPVVNQLVNYNSGPRPKKKTKAPQKEVPVQNRNTVELSFLDVDLLNDVLRRISGSNNTVVKYIRKLVNNMLRNGADRRIITLEKYSRFYGDDYVFTDGIISFSITSEFYGDKYTYEDDTINISSYMDFYGEHYKQEPKNKGGEFW